LHHPSGSTAIAVVPVVTTTPSTSDAVANLTIVASSLGAVLINPQWINENFDQGQKGRDATDRGEYCQAAGIVGPKRLKWLGESCLLRRAVIC